MSDPLCPDCGGEYAFVWDGDDESRSIGWCCTTFGCENAWQPVELERTPTYAVDPPARFLQAREGTGS